MASESSRDRTQAIRPEELPHVTVKPSDSDFNQNPYPTYASWHADHPSFWWDAYGHVCFAGFDTVNALLRDRRFGREILHVTSREELGLSPPADHVKPFYDFDTRSMLEREPPVHTRLRRLVNRAFVSRVIERLEPRIAQLTHELIDGFESDRSVDLIEHFATPIPVTIIAEMLGVPTCENQRLLDWSHKMVAMYQFNRSRDVEDVAVQATLEFSEFIGDLVDKHDTSGDDLIGTLLRAEAGGDALSRDELVTTCILLLNAGHEATVHTIGNGVKSILNSSLQPAQLFETDKISSATVEEILRYDPPLHMFTRWVLEDCEINSVALRKGDTIGLLLGAANHDPTRFDRADTFNPARPDCAHVSFGAGIHFCLGAPLARLELGVALPILFERLPNLQLAAPPVYADRYHFHGLEKLDVCW